MSLGWIASLLEREVDGRSQKALRKRIQDARFPEITALENFDFAFNPDIDEAKIRELATLKFIDQQQIALFLGAPGVGKTHLALAIGVLAVQDKRRVYCTSAKRLGQEIVLAKRRGTLDQLFKRILSSSLWIIDDWGVVTMTREVAEEIFDRMDRRKHSTAMILTSNRDVSQWSEVFPDPVIANATIGERDRDARIEDIADTQGVTLDQARQIRELEEELAATQKKLAQTILECDLLKKIQPNSVFGRKSSGYIETKQQLARYKGRVK